MDKKVDRLSCSPPDRAKHARKRSHKLYREIAETLREAIESSRYPVGSLLPTEADLCHQFHVSRHTVRAALKCLQDLGLIERRQGFGTQVVASSARGNFVQSVRSLAELTQYARDTHLDIQDVSPTVLSEEEASLIPASVGSRWLKIQGVRWTGDRSETICATTVYVHMRFGPLLKDVRNTRGPIYDLVEKRSGEMIAEAVQEISARPMPRAIATPLRVRAGTPALRFVRRYLDASGAPMLTSINWHPADRFVYRLRLKRDGADSY